MSDLRQKWKKRTSTAMAVAMLMGFFLGAHHNLVAVHGYDDHGETIHIAPISGSMAFSLTAHLEEDHSHSPLCESHAYCFETHRRVPFEATEALEIELTPELALGDRLYLAKLRTRTAYRLWIIAFAPKQSPPVLA